MLQFILTHILGSTPPTIREVMNPRIFLFYVKSRPPAATGSGQDTPEDDASKSLSYCIIFNATIQSGTYFRYRLLFQQQKRKEDDFMAVKYKRGSDGYFQAKVWDGTYTASGKRHYIRVRSKKSSRDLELKVAELNRKREQREGVKQTNETFVSYARLWKNLYKSGKSANTQAMYENIIEKHLTTLDGIPLQQIDRIHIQTVINNADGHSRTQQQIYMTFKQVLKSAVADHLFPTNVVANIFDNIERPDYSAGEKRPLTPYEKEAVFKADFQGQDKVFVYMIYGCGIRRGEALALTIFDFNLTDQTISISKSHEFSQKKLRGRRNRGLITDTVPSQYRTGYSRRSGSILKCSKRPVGHISFIQKTENRSA